MAHSHSPSGCPRQPPPSWSVAIHLSGKTERREEDDKVKGGVKADRYIEVKSLALKPDKSLVKLVLWNGWCNTVSRLFFFFSLTNYLCVSYNISLWGAEPPKKKKHHPKCNACKLQKVVCAPLKCYATLGLCFRICIIKISAYTHMIIRDIEQD